MEERYVVYWQGSSTHHYFETYRKAKQYVISNELAGARIAKVMAYMKSKLVELDEVQPHRDNGPLAPDQAKL